MYDLGGKGKVTASRVGSFRVAFVFGYGHDIDALEESDVELIPNWKGYGRDVRSVWEKKMLGYGYEVKE